VKVFAFGLIVAIVLGVTGYLIWSTVSINIKSVTGGPVHYHADFEIWNCGQKVDLIDPRGLDNKVGTPLLHEHNDNRIHIEGPVLDNKDISLGNFFKVVGGSMETSIKVPTNNGLITLEDGKCNGEFAEPQVFVYKTEGKTFSQERLINPKDYVISAYSSVPPGDCIIIELDKPKEKTDKICTFLKIAREKGELYEH
jgi:hypothetical protein